MNKFKKKKMESSYNTGDFMKVDFFDQNRRKYNTSKVNLRDKKAIMDHLILIENYSGFSIAKLINDRIKIGDWW